MQDLQNEKANQKSSTYYQNLDIRSSSYRYVNLVLFILTALINVVPGQTFVAIAPQAQALYSVSELMSYYIVYPFVFLPSNFVIEKYGLKFSTLINEILIICGLLVRLLINYHFSFFIIGTFISALGSVLILNMPNKFVVNWFPTSQIPIMNSICLFSIFMSDSLGSFTSALFLDQKSSKDDFYFFILMQSLIMIGILLLMIGFFKGKPKIAPNYCSQVERQDYKQSMKKLIKNENYFILFVSMTFVFSSMVIFLISVSWILQVYQFTSFQTGLVFILSNISGLAGCVLTGLLFDSKTYRRNCIIFLYFCALFSIVILLGLELQNPPLLYIGSTFYGFFMFPYMAGITDLASQTAFPVGQSISAGSIIFGGEILGIILAAITTVLLFDGKSKNKTRIGLALIFFNLLVGLALMYKSKNTLKRTQYEQSRKDLKQSLISKLEL